MLQKSNFLILLWLIGSVCSLSILKGQGTLAGTVNETNGEPVSGASVVIQSLSKGAFTGDNGDYRMEKIPAGAHEVTVKMLGMIEQTKTVTVVNGETIRLNFSMVSEVISTDEVVVIGYGTARKRDLVGSVSKFESDQLNDNIGASVETSLQGKAPGIQITQSSGVAGAASIVRIRGTASISSGGDPLYVVDGIPISQNYFVNATNGLDGLYPNVNNNPLASINPNDIESIEVLKDASAAAIYGSRGANGVILITTKRGKDGKAQFNFNSTLGTSEPTNILEILNSQELLQIRQEAWENSGNVGRAPLPTPLTSAGYTYDDIENVNTNWYDQVLRTGIKQEYNLGYRQGFKFMKVYAGVSYTNSESFLVGNQLKRYSGRLNLDFNLGKKVDLAVSTSYANTFTDRVRQESGGTLGLAQSNALPIYPIYDKEGNFFDRYNNPVAQLELQDWETDEWRTINNLKLTYRALENLTFNLTGNIDYLNIDDFIHEDSLWTTSDVIEKFWKTKTVNWSTYGTVNYDLTLGKNHRISLLGGLEFQENDSKGRFYREVAGVLDTTSDNSYDIDRYLFASGFARANYTFKDKAYLQVTYRRDGSSKFGANKRFGDFPSVGIGYILSEEAFLKDNPYVSFFKVKASWGLTGNADINWREQFATYNLVGGAYGGVNVRHQNQLENPDLQWEVGNTYDAGIELGFLNDRITTEFAYYYKRTTDAIIRTKIQASSGIENLDFFQNVGTIDNWGWEFQVTSRNLIGAFKWKTDLNFSHNKNKVLDVGTATPDALEGGFGDMRTIPGEEVATNYIIRFSHIDTETGRPVYLDANGAETFVYNPETNRVAAGAGVPTLIGGLTNTFSYKNIDLSVLFVYSLGAQIYDDAAKRQLGVVTMDDAWNYRAEIFDRWQKPGDEAKYPKLATEMTEWGGTGNAWQNNSTLWLEDADFLRLRKVTLGYNVPMSKANTIRGLKVTFSGTNLLTFTNYSGWDPEVARAVTFSQERNIGSANNTFLSSPQEKSYMLGLNIDF